MLKHGIIFMVIGLVVGYFIFGRVPLFNEYVNLKLLIFGYSLETYTTFSDLFVSSVINSIIEEIRQKVLVNGVFGFLVGLIYKKYK